MSSNISHHLSYGVRIALFLMLAGILSAEQVHNMQQGASKPEGRLTRVNDVKKVCMVTNKLFATDQIAVPINGRTYYGCCDMCKKILASDPKERLGKDPITGKKVDKTLAII